MSRLLNAEGQYIHTDQPPLLGGSGSGVVGSSLPYVARRFRFFSQIDKAPLHSVATQCILFSVGTASPAEDRETMKIYCDTCFDDCTGREAAAAPGICRLCGHPIVSAARDPHEHAVPMTLELAAEIRAHEAGMMRRDGLEDES